MKFEIELNEAQTKALSYVAEDPEFFLSNLVTEQCRLAIELIVSEQIQKMLQDPSINEIPADKEKIVLDADVESAAERYNKNTQIEI
jgi:hypothetical protein